MVKKNKKSFIKRFGYWGLIGFIIGLILGLIPYFIQVTPLTNIIHPISIQPSTLKTSTYMFDGMPLNMTKQFIVINNRNQILYGVRIIADLPKGLSTKDVTISRMTPMEDIDVAVYIPMLGGHSNSSGRDFFQLNIYRILPGQSNMIVYSVNITAHNNTEPIKLYCVGVSKTDEGILSNNGTMIQWNTPIFIPK